MSPLKISLKSLAANPLTSLLNVLLIAFGTGILTILVLASTQISDKLESNSKDIDLVVGAKGSPLQLILSSIFYIDFPTGNIPLKDANALSRHRMVKRAVPLALGDSYQGFRIVGTDTSFINLYSLQLEKGKFWDGNFDVTVGSEVAKVLNLKPGDTFHGAHGLTSGGDTHMDHAYVVAGILKQQNNVSDNLILTDIPSIWNMHAPGKTHDAGRGHAEAEPGDTHHQEHQHSDETHGATHEHAEEGDDEDREITSLLIQYHSPMAVVMFPRLVNQSTNMQAASPALETARLFSLIGVGVDTLQWFAILIMVIAAISVFVSLFNSLKERKYDIAVMRVMGASRSRIFIIVILEGVLLSLVGALIGIALGHGILQMIGSFQDSSQAKLSGLVFNLKELYILTAGLAIGIIASILPAIQAYRSDIASILSKG
ncbi:putative ABC transport system permease protein [Arcticibacter pallidicorallinus]|uniref:Putative ABC transport system permease protein n=1 Tax=Arcticibacter pallidicorallinus TaxID=1259464 RepID=A0A2T0TUY0_9SPHI|nr:FtsX-like permease family protein [Arcticibacter pallidicorallinus]PRY49471.1 putative ABC transport system permease protein [Arcticibacter pallidicorallinus]